MKLKKMGALSLALAMTVTAMTGCAMPSTGGSDTTAAPTQERTAVLIQRRLNRMKRLPCGLWTGATVLW